MGCFDVLIQKIKHKKERKSESVSSINSYYTTSRSVNSSASQKHTIFSKSSDSASSPRSIPSLYEERGHYNLRVFKYNELKSATNNFSRFHIIGEGGFGCVYKGLVKPQDGKGDNIVVAIKKLNKNGLQGHKQWLTEVQFLGVVEHPNLVKLIGYCAVDGERGTQRLLVYEFMPNGSLEDHLFNSSYQCLSWSMRLQILLGVAQGLTYLHEGLEVQVIFRDFKASNILLDKEFNPKLSDFGLAREGPSEGDTHVSTAVMGTYGYAAPDYVETGHLTEKSDVWSFGVVLYEILTGRKSMERNRPRNEQKLLDWVKRYPADSKKFNNIIDPRLENQYPLESAREIARLANKCLSKNARERPKMYEVVESIKQAMVHKEMDGHMEIGNDDVDLDNENENEEERSNKSMQRRMLHLDKLKESANVIGKRRLFMLSKIPDS